MMFSLFTASAFSSVQFNEHVLHLTSLPPNDENTYAVMIHTESCPHCVRLAPTWNHAAELGAGSAIFADLNCHENRTACESIATDQVPRILLFKNKVINEYPKMLPQVTLSIVEWVSSFMIPDFLEVTKENYTQIVGENAAILFSDKRPMSWVSSANYYNDKKVKFVISSDKELFNELKLPKYPGVYAKVGNEYKLYTGKVNSIPVKEFLDSQFNVKQDNKEL
ncbi:hypothetical protein TVAG_352530 [Trichomonas vaginalis G3]|uniref:Thioredoxin domain-containing protein n=1 Tax=Trichomonas vaginalis (strain ATCC PRA-98 / G3) TaxID=412133 RepID=A2EG55_TRIV3|nr:disulfide-isomerase A6 family [Trichomonas vaginalis G3]EAY08331.1 hypothetical protein TVAG_352530 [Trichomonas vaginalis G3]KAI5546234.1 disulfide-isomerase A6 family [Trichomonas vaginalis G3]|eukprot:XP_001320554.1 hypothetical protein [Trichomonas vaginalis G3]